MKSLKTIAVAILCLTFIFSYQLIPDYERLDTYNQAAGRFQWVSRMGDETIYIQKVGNGRQYVTVPYTNKGEGVLDKNGREVIPCEYESVAYHGGNYMAVATTSEYKLFNMKGKEAASFNRISFPYAYAGDRYFIKYGDDHIEHWQDGFQVLDVISGQTIASYDDCYNAVRLDDGNWYISRTPDTSGTARRWTILDPYGSLPVEPQEGEADPPVGFFVNEEFEEMFHGKAYRLICQGDGLYVATAMQEGTAAESSPDAAESAAQESSPDAAEGAARAPVVVLDETGELFQVTDEAALKRIKVYENGGDLVYGTRTIFKGENGLIGFAPLNQTNDIVYVDENGRRAAEKETPGYALDAQYGINKGLQLFSETKVEDGFERTLYGIKDPSGGVIIPPLFEEITFLPDTENILINGDMGCGVIRLEGR